MKHPKKLHTLATMILTLVVAVGIAQFSHAAASADYSTVTGAISVSVANVSNWYIQSASAQMTGTAAGADTLPLAGGLLSDSDIRIGEWKFGGDFSYDVDLGMVAQAGLPEGDGVVLLADFDNDNAVEGNDFLLWQTGFGDPYDATDLANWNAEFGTISSPADLTIWFNGPGVGQPLEKGTVVYLSSMTANISAVPEPGSIVLLAVAGLAVLGRRR